MKHQNNSYQQQVELGQAHRKNRAMLSELLAECFPPAQQNHTAQTVSYDDGLGRIATWLAEIDNDRKPESEKERIRRIKRQKKITRDRREQEAMSFLNDIWRPIDLWTQKEQTYVTNVLTYLLRDFPVQEFMDEIFRDNVRNVDMYPIFRAVLRHERRTKPRR